MGFELTRLTRQALYSLEQEFGGGPVHIYKLLGSSVNYQTGVPVVTKDVTTINRVIILPTTLKSDVNKNVSVISANKAFAYGGQYNAESRTFIIDRRKAGSLSLTQDDWLVYDGKKYEITSFDAFDDDTAWVIVARQLQGVVPEQIFRLAADDLLTLSSTSRTVEFLRALLSIQQSLAIQSQAGQNLVRSESLTSTLLLQSIAALTYELNLAQALSLNGAAGFVRARSGAAENTLLAASAADALLAYSRGLESTLALSSALTVLRAGSNPASNSVALDSVSSAVANYVRALTSDLVLSSSSESTFDILGNALSAATLSAEVIQLANFVRTIESSVLVSDALVNSKTATLSEVHNLVLDTLAAGVKDITNALTSGLNVTSDGSYSAIFPRSLADTLVTTSAAVANLAAIGIGSDALSLITDAIGTKAAILAEQHSLVLDSISSALAAFSAAGTDIIVLTDTSQANAAFAKAEADTLALSVTLADTRVAPRAETDAVSLTSTAAAELVVPVSGYAADWGKRFSYTINPNAVAADLTDFPVVLGYNDFPSDAFTNAKTNGDDLRASSDEAGTIPLAVDVRIWNPSSTKVDVAIKIPAVSSSTNTVIYIWYQNSVATFPSVSDADEGQYAVYDANFVGVYPMTNVVSDSLEDDQTSYQNDLAPTTGRVPAAVEGELFGNCQAYNSDDQTKGTLAGVGSINTVTFSMFIKPTATASNYDGLISNATGTALLLGDSNVVKAMWVGTGWTVTTGLVVTNSQWQYISMAVDSAKIRLNVVKTGGTTAYSIVQSNANANMNSLHFVGDDRDLSGRTFNGYIDEVHISKVARSDSWCRLQGNLGIIPTVFRTIGSPVTI